MKHKRLPLMREPFCVYRLSDCRGGSVTLPGSCDDCVFWWVLNVTDGTHNAADSSRQVVGGSMTLPYMGMDLT